jgi:hypothetical protein
MNYWQHWKLNMQVAGKAFLLCAFHCIHAFIPCEQTSHHYWNLHLGKPED